MKFKISRPMILAFAILAAGLFMGCVETKKVSKANFDAIQEGMSYTEVVRIIGSSGEEMASNKMDGIPGVMLSISTKMYSWQNSDGSNMNALFQNDRLVNKAQFGLDNKADFNSFVWWWISLSFIAGGIAKIKKHSFLKYFLLSLLLSPIILIIFALVTKPNTAVMEKEMIDSGEGKKCPFCAEIIKAEAKVCRYCRKDLPEERLNERQINSEESAVTKWECPVCGEESDISSSACWKCKESRI